MDQETLNSSGNAEATASSAVENRPYPTGPIPTIIEGLSAQGEAQNHQDQEKAEDNGTATETKTEAEAETKSEAKEDTKAETKEEAKSTDDDRFDKHPRFQELLKGKKESDRRLQLAEQKFEEMGRKYQDLERRLTEQATKAPEMDDEKLAEMYDQDPVKAIKFISDKAKADAKRELRDEITSETSQRETFNRMSSALKEFIKGNSDFQEMWDSGELQQLADENPLFNTPIAAYLHVSGQKKLDSLKAEMTKAMEDAVSAARKEERDKAAKEIEKIKADVKAKREITVLPERSASKPASGSIDAELKNTNGNLVGTLTQRLLNRRAAGL